MLKDIIEHNNKIYQLSAVKLNGVFEIMVFPIENGVVSNNEVYCFRTARVNEFHNKYKDIYYHSEKYLSDEAIEKYLACQKCSEWCCTLCKYLDIRTLQRT